MDKAKCSDQPRYWAGPSNDNTGRWFIYDRDRADKHIATLNTRCQLNWHHSDYWRAHVDDWREAINNAMKAETA